MKIPVKTYRGWLRYSRQVKRNSKAVTYANGTSYFRIEQTVLILT